MGSRSMFLDQFDRLPWSDGCERHIKPASFQRHSDVCIWRSLTRASNIYNYAPTIIANICACTYIYILPIRESTLSYVYDWSLVFLYIFVGRCGDIYPMD